MGGVLSLKDTNQKNFNSKKQFLVYIVLIIPYIGGLISEPYEVVSSEAYGFVENLYLKTTIASVSIIYLQCLFITGFIIIYLQMKNTQKNRVKKQMKIILITGLGSIFLVPILNLTLTALGIVNFPPGAILFTIPISGVCYAVNKYKMMSVSYELVSEYLFEAVNEPIFILGEDLLVKNCNEAALNITGYNLKDLEQYSLDKIINFNSLNFKNIMQAENTINIDVDLHRKNKEALICELSATVVYDEYNDILGNLVLLHDVSERKKIVEIQEKYTLKLEESNLSLKNEIKERLLAVYKMNL